MAYEVDVLIIGAGPTGSTTALALANSGVRCHIVSRGNWMADSPRAHIANQRANEVFRDLGISEDVTRYASPWELMGDTTFTTSLAGDELIRMRTWGTGDDRRGDYLQASPCGMIDIIQPLLEPILFQKAAEKGATFAFNTEYVRHEQDSDGVTATLRDRLDGREFTIRARTWSAPTARDRPWSSISIFPSKVAWRAQAPFTRSSTPISRGTANIVSAS
jgi:2,4-dichlorophenol 6-monooxygenase